MGFLVDLFRKRCRGCHRRYKCVCNTIDNIAMSVYRDVTFDRPPNCELKGVVFFECTFPQGIVFSGKYAQCYRCVFSSTAAQTVVVRSGCEVDFIECEFSAAGGAAILCRSQAVVHLVDCFFDNVKLDAIQVDSDASVSLDRCSLSTGARCGILATGNAAVAVTNCKLEGFTRAAIEVAGCATAAIESTHIVTSAGGVGVRVYDSGDVRIENSTVVSLGRPCVAAHHTATVATHRCAISGSRSCGVLLVDAAQGDVSECALVRHGLAAIGVLATSMCALDACVFSDCVVGVALGVEDTAGRAVKAIHGANTFDRLSVKVPIACGVRSLEGLADAAAGVANDSLGLGDADAAACGGASFGSALRSPIPIRIAAERSSRARREAPDRGARSSRPRSARQYGGADGYGGTMHFLDSGGAGGRGAQVGMGAEDGSPTGPYGGVGPGIDLLPFPPGAMMSLVGVDGAGGAGAALASQWGPASPPDGGGAEWPAAALGGDGDHDDIGLLSPLPPAAAPRDDVTHSLRASPHVSPPPARERVAGARSAADAAAARRRVGRSSAAADVARREVGTEMAGGAARGTRTATTVLRSPSNFGWSGPDLAVAPPPLSVSGGWPSHGGAQLHGGVSFPDIPAEEVVSVVGGYDHVVGGDAVGSRALTMRLSRSGPVGRDSSSSAVGAVGGSGRARGSRGGRAPRVSADGTGGARTPPSGQTPSPPAREDPRRDRRARQRSSGDLSMSLSALERMESLIGQGPIGSTCRSSLDEVVALPDTTIGVRSGMSGVGGRLAGM